MVSSRARRESTCLIGHKRTLTADCAFVQTAIDGSHYPFIDKRDYVNVKFVLSRLPYLCSRHMCVIVKETGLSQLRVRRDMSISTSLTS